MIELNFLRSANKSPRGTYLKKLLPVLGNFHRLASVVRLPRILSVRVKKSQLSPQMPDSRSEER